MTDTEIIEAITRIIAVEQFPSDAVRRIRELLTDPGRTRGFIAFEDAVIPLPDNGEPYDPRD